MLGVASLVFLAHPGTPAAEILTKGNYGGRQAYLKRVQDLSAILSGMAGSDESKRAEMRAVASTLSAAVKDRKSVV